MGGVRMKSNKGFSLIELLVIIAIMGVGLGIAAMSIASLSAADVRRCAADMNSMLSKARVNSMYRGDPVVEIRIDGTDRVIGEYIENGVVMQSEFLGRRGGYTVRIINPADGSPLQPPLTAGSGGVIRIGFQRGTGRLMRGGTLVPSQAASIVIERGPTRYRIDFISATGRHTVERR
jgi:prepilin-type N-terminal cleavage/methylation domain-containing protein